MVFLLVSVQGHRVEFPQHREPAQPVRELQTTIVDKYARNPDTKRRQGENSANVSTGFIQKRIRFVML